MRSISRYPACMVGVNQENIDIALSGEVALVALSILLMDHGFDQQCLALSEHSGQMGHTPHILGSRAGGRHSCLFFALLFDCKAALGTSFFTPEHHWWPIILLQNCLGVLNSGA